jgi:hypothetical protein
MDFIATFGTLWPVLMVARLLLFQNQKMVIVLVDRRFVWQRHTRLGMVLLVKTMYLLKIVLYSVKSRFCNVSASTRISIHRRSRSAIVKILHPAA